MSIVGLSLSDKNARLVEFKKGIFSSTSTLSVCTEVPADKLSDLKKRYGLKNVRLAISDEKACIFKTEIKKTKNIREALSSLIELKIPTTLDESDFNFEIVGAGENKGELDVAVTVFSKKVIESYKNILKSAGLNPIYFCTESQALARAVISKKDERTTLLINIDEEKTGFYIVENEVVVYSNIKSLGSRGMGNYPDLKNLKAELNKIIVFWNTRLTKNGMADKKIERIIVCGEGVRNEDFIAELVSGIEIEHSLANVWTNILSLKQNIPNVSFNESLVYGPAIGVTLESKR